MSDDDHGPAPRPADPPPRAGDDRDARPPERCGPRRLGGDEDARTAPPMGRGVRGLILLASTVVLVLAEMALPGRGDSSPAGGETRSESWIP